MTQNFRNTLVFLSATGALLFSGQGTAHAATFVGHTVNAAGVASRLAVFQGDLHALVSTAGLGTDPAATALLGTALLGVAALVRRLR